MKQIVGYSDKISVRPGETISFMVSCEKRGPYQARVVQIIHGDTNPEGPGYKERAVTSSVDGTYQGRKQEIQAGSFAAVPASEPLERLTSFSVQAMIWPTTPDKPGQTLISRWSANSSAGFCLEIAGNAGLTLRLGDGRVFNRAPIWQADIGPRMVFCGRELRCPKRGGAAGSGTRRGLRESRYSRRNY